jgi:membrane protease YdiL (CAAX protease family)
MERDGTTPRLSPDGPSGPGRAGGPGGPGGPDVSWRTIVVFAAVVAVVDVVSNAMVSGDAQLPLKLLVIAVMLWWAHSVRGFSWVQLGLGRRQLGAGLRLGALAALLVVAVIAVAVAIPATRSYFDSSSVHSDSAVRQVLAPLLVIPLGTVLFEETIFRGVLLALLLRRCTRWRAIIVSAVLFGLWHLVPAISSADGKSVGAAIGTVVGTLAVTTAAGVAFAWLRLRSGSLAAPILAHVATNSLAYTAATIVS